MYVLRSPTYLLHHTLMRPITTYIVPIGGHSSLTLSLLFVLVTPIRNNSLGALWVRRSVGRWVLAAAG